MEDLLNPEKTFALSNYKQDTEYKVPKDIIDETSLKPITNGDGQELMESNMRAVCKEYIEQAYPSVEIPGVFGSHGNAEVTSQKMEAAILIDSLLCLQPRDAGSLSKSREQAIINLIEENMKKLPEEINYYEARQRH